MTRVPAAQNELIRSGVVTRTRVVAEIDKVVEAGDHVVDCGGVVRLADEIVICTHTWQLSGECLVTWKVVCSPSAGGGPIAYTVQQTEETVKAMFKTLSLDKDSKAAGSSALEVLNSGEMMC